jgi:hypothetical protein
MVSEALIIAGLYLPGFIAFKVYEWKLNSSRRYNAYETTMYSLLFSIVGIYALLVYKGIYEVDFALLSKINILDGLIFFIVSIILGWFVALGKNFMELRLRRFTRDAWNDFFVRAWETEKAPQLKVITSDGSEYIGFMNFVGARYDKKEISLIKPIKIYRDRKGKFIDHEKLGKEILFTENDIRRIVWVA